MKSLAFMCSVVGYFERCGHPAQQHGLRIPPFIFESAFAMRIPRVSVFFPDVTQQIHSLRASGVISLHAAFTTEEESMAFRKSVGRVCTALFTAPFLVIRICC